MVRDDGGCWWVGGEIGLAGDGVGWREKWKEGDCKIIKD